jgi:hypothetical protein
MTISDRELTAYHEAGHAVAHVILHIPFRYVTLRPRSDEAAGRVMCQRASPCPPDDSAQYQLEPEGAERAIESLLEAGQPLPAASARESRHDAWCMTLFAGEVAAALATWSSDGRPSEHYALRDFWWQQHVTGSDAHALTEVASPDYLDWVGGETRSLIEEYWESVEAVAAALLENSTLSQAEVRALVA